MEELNKTYKEGKRILRLVRGTYANNDAVYFGLIDEDTKEPFCDITVNLHFSSKSVIEIDNDFRNYSSLKLVKNIIKDLTDSYLIDDYNGFCSYPVYLIKSELILAK